MKISVVLDYRLLFQFITKPAPFPARQRSNKRTKEHAWGEQKIGEKLGGSEREGGRGRGEKESAFPSLVSLPPSAPCFSHSLPRSLVSFA